MMPKTYFSASPTLTVKLKFDWPWRFRIVDWLWCTWHRADDFSESTGIRFCGVSHIAILEKIPHLIERTPDDLVEMLERDRQ